MSEERPRTSAEGGEGLVFAALSAQSVTALAAFALTALTASSSLRSLACYAAAGLLIWLASLAQHRLRRRAREERADREAAESRRQAQGLSSLFEDGGDGAARNLRQWDSVMAPIISLIIALALIAPAVFFALTDDGGLAGALWSFPREGLRRELLAAALIAIAAFGCLALGLYIGGLSRAPERRSLRAGAGVMLVTAAFAGLSVAALAAAAKWSMTLDRLVGIGLLALMALQALEIFANLFLDLFRPRVPGVELRPSFDSRLSGLLAEPRGLSETVAHTLDYQFGFKVSETFFYRFLERAFAPLLLILAVTYYGLGCFFVVRPGERALVERWGSPRGIRALPDDDAGFDQLRPPLAAGLHVKWPWPIEAVRRFDSERVTSLRFDTPDGASAEAASAIWDKDAPIGADYVLPRPPDPEESEAESGVLGCVLLRLSFSIDYKVGAARRGDLYRYAYLHADPQASVRATFEREMTAILAGAPLSSLLGGAAAPTSPSPATIAKRLQAAADRARLGIEVVAFNLEDARPTSSRVGKAYQQVIGAKEARAGAIRLSEIEARLIKDSTPAEVSLLLEQARAQRYQLTQRAKARARRFAGQMNAYEAAPDVYERRLLLEVLEESLSGARKFVVPPGMEMRLDRSQAGDAMEDILSRGLRKSRENKGGGR